MPEGQYLGIPLQATINLFINWFLDLTLNPRFNQAIMGFTRPLWIFLGHHGSAILGHNGPSPKAEGYYGCPKVNT